MLAYSGRHVIILYKQCVTALSCRSSTADARLRAQYADMLTCEDCLSHGDILGERGRCGPERVQGPCNASAAQIDPDGFETRAIPIAAAAVDAQLNTRTAIPDVA